MSVVVDAVFVARDKEAYQTLYQMLTAILPDTAAFDGAILISCAADEETYTFNIHEVWKSAAHQRRYLAWRTERGDVEPLVALLAEPPQFNVKDHLVF